MTSHSRRWAKASVLLLILVVLAQPTVATRRFAPIATTSSTTTTSEETTTTISSRARRKKKDKSVKLGRRKKDRKKNGIYVKPSRGNEAARDSEEEEVEFAEPPQDEFPANFEDTDVTSPARIINEPKEGNEEASVTEAIQAEEAMLQADQEDLLMELGIKEGEAAEEEKVAQEELATILSNTGGTSSGSKKMEGQKIATTGDVAEDVTVEEESEDSEEDSNDGGRRRSGGRIYTTQRTSSTSSSSSIWTKPRQSGGGATRRNLKLRRGVTTKAAANKQRRQLKGGGASELKLSGTSKGKKVSKGANAARKASPIDCKERTGKKCKQKGIKKTAGESRGSRITKEGGVLEREIEPDYSLSDVTTEEAYDMMYQESKAFPMVDVGGSGGSHGKRFYNGEDAEDTTAGTAPAGKTFTEEGEGVVPEFEPRPIPTRVGSAEHPGSTRASSSTSGGTNGFRGRASFYGQASEAESTATTISGGDSDTAESAYDEYEAWFNQMDAVDETDGDATEFYAADDAGGETVDPVDFFEDDDDEDDDENEDDEDENLGYYDEAGIADFFAVDEVADETADDETADTVFDANDEDSGVDIDAFFAVDDEDEADIEGEEVDVDAFFAVDDEDEEDEEDDQGAFSSFFAEEDNEDDEDEEGSSYLAAYDETPETIAPGEHQTTTFANSIPESETAAEAIREEYSVHSEQSNGVTFWEESVEAKPIYVQARGSADLSTKKQEFFDSLEPLLTRHLETVLGNDLVEDYQLTMTYIVPEDQVIQLRRGSDAKTYTTQLVVLVLLHLRNEDKETVAAVTPDVATKAVKSFFDPGNVDLRTLLRVLNAKGVPTKEIHAQGEPHPPRNHAMDHGISGLTATDTAVHDKDDGTSRGKKAALAALFSALFMVAVIAALFCYNRQRREKIILNGRAVLDAASDVGSNAVESVRLHGSNAVESVRSQVRRNRGQRKSYFNFNKRSTGASLHSNGSSTISYIQPAAIQLRRNRPKSVEVPNTPLAGRQDDRFDTDSKPSSIYDIDINDDADLTGVRSHDDSESLIELDNEMDSDEMSMIEEEGYEGSYDGDDYSRQSSVDRISLARNKVAMEEHFVDEEDVYSSMLTRSTQKKGYRSTASGNAMTQKSFVPLSPLSAALAEALADESPRHITHTASRAPTPPMKNYRGLDPEPNLSFNDNYHYGSAMSPPISMEDIMPDEYINQERWRDQIDDESSSDDQNTVESSVMTGMTPETRIIVHDNELSNRRKQYRY